MMWKMKRLLAFFLLIFLLFSFFLLKLNFAQEVMEEEQNKITQAEENAEKIVPSPKDIKESTGIYVFVAWMWIAIIVLIYILRLKIKEVDRLFYIHFFSTKKK